MRPIYLAVIACLSLSAHAAQPEPPAKSEPPPPMSTDEPIDEPQVTIIKKTDQVIEEYRVGGRLYMIKITPKYGPPYYLVDDQGDGKFARQEGLDTGFRVPRWIIKRF